MEKPDNIPEGDFANYFCTYGFLYHQKEMLEDQVRMQAYYDAVHRNRACFEGKVVLDVGTGSGILAIWAAQAGARRVYAVEATFMANNARTLVKHNGLEDIVVVHQCAVEDLHLPEKVDIIISEWMGYFLLRESMLDSVIVARDKWLKPGGAMFPSHARVLLAPIEGRTGRKKQDEFADALEGWQEFCDTTHSKYGVDMSCLGEQFENEQRQYYLQTSLWQDVSPSQLLGEPVVLLSYDLHRVTVADVLSPSAQFKLHVERVSQVGTVDALCAWFDVDFRGSDELPCEEKIVLDTSPDEQGSTHWGQQVMYLHPPQPATCGDVLTGSFRMQRKKENHRLMSVQFTLRHGRAEQLGPERQDMFSVE